MDKYGWFQFETKEVVQRKDSFWLREHFKREHHHSNHPGLKYNVMLIGSLRDEILERIEHYALSQTKTVEQVAHIIDTTGLIETHKCKKRRI